jgi:hypothetical protein
VNAHQSEGDSEINVKTVCQFLRALLLATELLFELREQSYGRLGSDIAPG